MLLSSAFEKVLREQFRFRKIKKKNRKKVETEKKHCLISGTVKEKWAKRTHEISIS